MKKLITLSICILLSGAFNAQTIVRTIKELKNYTSNTVIGTAPATICKYNAFVIPQTTTGITLTLPKPQTYCANDIVIINSGTKSFTMYGNTIDTGKAVHFIYTDKWYLSGAASSGGGAADGNGVYDGSGFMPNGTYIQLDTIGYHNNNTPTAYWGYFPDSFAVSTRSRGFYFDNGGAVYMVSFDSLGNTGSQFLVGQTNFYYNTKNYTTNQYGELTFNPTYYGLFVNEDGSNYSSLEMNGQGDFTLYNNQYEIQNGIEMSQGYFNLFCFDGNTNEQSYITLGTNYTDFTLHSGAISGSYIYVDDGSLTLRWKPEIILRSDNIQFRVLNDKGDSTKTITSDGTHIRWENKGKMYVDNSEKIEYLYTANVTSTDSTELFLNSSNAYVTIGTNEVWCIQAQVVAVCYDTTGSLGVLSLGDSFSTTYNITLKNIAGSISVLDNSGADRNSFKSYDSSMSNAGVIIYPNESNQTFRLKFARPISAGSFTVSAHLNVVKSKML